jgi:nicotinamide-nucleotide amidase
MATDIELFELAGQVGHRLLAADRRIVTAESCTGGWIAKALTDVAGSSRWVEGGFVTYSNSAKVRDLGVSARTLAQAGAVSEATVREMAEGALRVSGADVAIAVSGIAGPDGGTPDKPVGTVWFCAAARRGGDVELVSEVERFPGNREAVRRLSVERGLKLVLSLELPAAPRATQP